MAGVATYEELFGAQPWQLPVLRQVQIQHERVWSFVTCYMHARRINTLFECHTAFLMHEGIQQFSELGIGNSFLHTDAVQSLYHAPSTIYPLTTHDVLKTFRQFESMLGHDAFASGGPGGGGGAGGGGYNHQRPPQRIDREQFKQFISQQRRQPSAEAMGLHIDADGFGPYIAMLRRISKKEQREIHELQEEFNKGIADRVFELSKEKFSAENRQQALADLMQRTNDERAAEMARGGGNGSGSGSGSGGHSSGRGKPATTLSSLSLDILNRVTDVDVYLDNVLRRKSADERFKPRLQAHAIADTDQKIRTQLTQFLLASQKSRHHARVKVVTWVLCGVLAKIHTLLQLDDKLPEAAAPSKDPSPTASKSSTGQRDADGGGDDDDEGEECDCCCVGEDTCRCRCLCECHRDESDDDSKKAPGATATSAIAVDEDEELQHKPEQQSPAKRKRSRSRSDSVALAESSASSLEDVQSALQRFLADQLASMDASEATAESTMALLARADQHLRSTFGESVLGRFSLVQELHKTLQDETQDDNGDAKTGDDSLRHVVDCLRRGDGVDGPRDSISGSALSEDEVREFIGACVDSVATELTDPASTSAVHDAILHQVCVQFSIDCIGNTRTREKLQRLIQEVATAKRDGRELQGHDHNHDQGSVVHYASALALPATVHSLLQNQGTGSNALALLEDGAAREQVLAVKTQEALAMLAQCPYLVDVSEWTHWRTRFEPFCGSLRAFLRSHEMIRLDDDRVRSSTTMRSEFVCCTNSQIVRIRSSDEVSASALDAVGLSCEQVAVELVSLFVQHRGSLDDFPRALVLLHLRTILKHVATTSNGASSSSSAAEMRVARFVLDVLLVVPLNFASFVVSLLEDAALPLALESYVAKSCRSRFERRRLQLIGAAVTTKRKWTELENDGEMMMQRLTSVLLPAPQSQPSGVTVVSRISSAEDDDQLQSTTAPTTVAGTSAKPEPVQAAIVPLDTSACESFISTLRRDQFGIGLEIADAATRSVLQAQHRRLERALKRLSDELYSEKTHFVLELLQNADDNKYARGVVPRGEFVLTQEGEIVFINNEIGFNRANIQAICDVGASTKEHEQEQQEQEQDAEQEQDQGAMQKHSIGKKGIGFKSVFKISNEPEVHSNGFHIQFRVDPTKSQTADGLTNSAGLGYILPHWIEDTARWRRTSGTTFVLPMNEHSRQRQHEISSSLLAYEPSVLLFLQKIRELRLTNQVTGGRLAYEKHETTVAVLTKEGENKTTISVATLSAERAEGEGDGDGEGDNATPTATTRQQQQRWFIVRRQLATPAAFVATKGHFTEIAIAIPEHHATNNDDDNENNEDQAPLQPVFCYLPLRSYGFRFILQGDFEVPSSREAISNGSDWNQWLVAQFPALLPSLVGFLKSEKLSLRHLLRVLPLDSDIQAPFRSIVGEISREIRQLPCFPSASVNSRGGDAPQLFTASELLDTSEFTSGTGGDDDEEEDDEDDVKFLLDDSDDSLLWRALHKRVLNVALARAMPALLKAQLRIERLRASHVLRLLSHVCAVPASSSSASAGRRDPLLVLKLLQLLVKLWRHDRHRALLVQELRRIKCFPVVTSQQSHVEWKSLAEIKGGALFIRSLKTRNKSNVAAASATMTELLVDDELSLLRDDFTALLETKFTETRRFLVEHLGVKELEDHDLITHHILPAMTAMAPTSTSASSVALEAEQKWREHVKFLAAHVTSGCGTNGSACPLRSAIRKAMRAITWRGRVVACDQPSDTELEVFVVVPAVAKKLENCITWLRGQVARTSGLDVVALDAFGSVDSSSNDDAMRALWVDTCRLPELFDASSDSRSHAALGRIVQWIQNEPDLVLKRSVSAELVRYMDSTWSSSTTAMVSTSDTGSSSQWYQQARWLEGSDGEFYRPQDLWVSCAAVVSLFTNSSMVPISKTLLESETLRNDWQLKSVPTTSDVLAVLERMSAKAVESDTTVEHMSRLYGFLLEQSRVDGVPTAAACIRSAFAAKPLVFVPSDDNDHRSGRFVSVEDAVWSSGSGSGSGSIASLAAVALEDVYAKPLRAFFVGVCGVERKPTADQLQHALVSVLTTDSSSSPMRKREWISSVVPVLRLLAKPLHKRKLTVAEIKSLKKTLRSLAWVPVSFPTSSSSPDRDSKKKFHLSVPKQKHTTVVFCEGDDGREIQRLWLSLASGKTTGVENKIQFVAVEDEEVLTDLVPLFRLAGIASIQESLLSHPAEWCAWLSDLGETALRTEEPEHEADADVKSRRRALKKYEKLLKCVLTVWARAFSEDGEATLRRFKDFALALSTQPLFPCYASPSLQRGVDLFLNDQSEWSREQLLPPPQHSLSSTPLLVLSLFAWDFFPGQRDQRGQYPEATRGSRAAPFVASASPP